MPLRAPIWDRTGPHASFSDGETARSACRYMRSESSRPKLEAKTSQADVTARLAGGADAGLCSQQRAQGGADDIRDRAAARGGHDGVVGAPVRGEGGSG
ncbi:hypothetical protein, partial [Sorangium cellulosum]|uniref:hypothetical protein n=1 Tax=Sorangium cellulosum TaxID=56 RepID=UPI000B02AC02